MILHTKEPKRPTYFIPNFELRSVLLFAALTMGAAAVTRAQTSPTAPATTRNSTSARLALSAKPGVIPASQVVIRGAEAAFNRADRDGDGKLSRLEIEHFPALAQHFGQIDSNRDHFISPEEFNQAAAR
jgi:hypothetical protein